MYDFTQTSNVSLSRTQLWRKIKAGEYIAVSEFLLPNPFNTPNFQIHHLNETLKSSADHVALTNETAKIKDEQAARLLKTSLEGGVNDTLIVQRNQSKKPNKILGDYGLFQPIVDAAPEYLKEHIFNPRVVVFSPTHFMDYSQSQVSAIDKMIGFMQVFSGADAEGIMGKEFLSSMVNAIGDEFGVTVSDFGTFKKLVLESVGPKRGRYLKMDYEQFITDQAVKTSFNLYWKGRLAGEIYQGGDMPWRINRNQSWVLPTTPHFSKDIPPFILNLLPETKKVTPGSLLNELSQEPDLLGEISVRKPESQKVMPEPYLEVSLAALSVESMFDGQLSDIHVIHGQVNDGQKLLSKVAGRPLSGCASKIPVNLSMGLNLPELKPASGAMTSTHLFKFFDNLELRYLPFCEWYGMEMTRVAQIEVPSFSMVVNTDSHTNQFSNEDQETSLDSIFDSVYSTIACNTFPTYLIERFDLNHKDEKTFLHGEEFASIFGISPENKYDYLSYQDVVDYIKKESSTVQRDLDMLLKQLIVNTLIKNNDLHAKNLSMLREYDRETGALLKQQLSPAYDVVTWTDELFQAGGVSDKHAMRLIDSNDFSIENLLKFGQKCLEKSEDYILRIVSEVSSAVLGHAIRLSEKAPDKVKAHHPNCIPALEKCRNMCIERYQMFYADKAPIKDPILIHKLNALHDSVEEQRLGAML